MTFSIDVLPAPFGPMMARISPRFMSKETLRIARTPPKESETFSATRSVSPESGVGAIAAEVTRHARAEFHGQQGGRFRYPRCGRGRRARLCGRLRK